MQALPSPPREQAQRALRCEWPERGRGFPEEGTLPVYPPTHEGLGVWALPTLIIPILGTDPLSPCLHPVDPAVPMLCLGASYARVC